MLGFLLIFGGLGALAAAAGSGGKPSDTSPQAPPPAQAEVVVPVIVEPEDTHDHGDPDMASGDTPMDHGDPDMADDDTPMDHGDHDMADDDTPMDHGDHDMADDDTPMDHGDHDMADGDTPMDHGDHDMADDDAPMDHGDHDMADNDTPMDHGDHDMADGDTPMDHGDHDGHDMGSAAIPLPETQDDIAAFVAAVRASPEVHSHDHGSDKAGEHMAAMDLVPRDEATHIAISHGDWDDPSNWHNGEVPGDDARVLIPEGVHMTYDHVSDARLFTVRVDGKLEFATDVDSQMIVDTIVTTPGSHLQIGTEDNPVEADVNVDIIFANNGDIDTTWDPLLLSRGMIGHGKTEIHGTAKDSHDKVVDDPKIGDTWV
ncbi:MAG: G8 domain-containing protein, partial [Pseudomonadota bacterium]